ncbi:TIR domain-containing protein [Aliarcobacter butzleri]|uniref:TIR domain-containing protein n=1 Tax=Aliarcobacter butzleri TaxID=28197 RepID=A0AAW7Q7H7_9BACT|nr:TIR domain-containing protein [Aliarcobacter butzleri]MDN5107216.1 TIR domain-containing protein [Aliarcobacter butzleri]MDN5122342.1 TIR domain-containing protein [Aliarcobacter butzleri]
MSKDYKVFISHSWQYSNDLMSLRRLLNERGYFNVSFEEVPKDEPIDSLNATYIKMRLSQKIDNSDIVIGLAGIYASYSYWMEWELSKAKSLGKPIIGVIPWGQERISTTVSSKSIVDVRWNTESIVNAIRQHAK